MLATENRTRSRIKRILAIALPVVGRQIRTIRAQGAILVTVLGIVVSGFSQTTVSTGGIQGTVTDPSGALVTGAIVSITNTATGQTAYVNTNFAGAYTFAFLKPADYVVRIEARSFIGTVSGFFGYTTVRRSAARGYQQPGFVLPSDYLGDVILVKAIFFLFPRDAL